MNLHKINTTSREHPIELVNKVDTDKWKQDMEQKETGNIQKI